MIALILRLCIVGLAVAWGVALTWLFPLFPLLTLWLVALPLLGFMGGLLLSYFFLYGSLRQQQPATANDNFPSGTQMARAAWGELWASLKVYFWWQPFRTDAYPDFLPERPSGQHGVVLIHGFTCNRALWQPWFPRLRAKGHAYVAVNLEPVFGSIDAYVSVIDDAVKRVTQATGKPPVLVCHSMGGLAARAWLRAGLKMQGAGIPRVRRVERVITIGTPHNGTRLTRVNPFVFAENALQMRESSRWIKSLQDDEIDNRSNFSPQAGGGVYGRFICFYGHCDNVVYPMETATLPGADNRHVAATAHVAMALTPSVIDDCLGLIKKL